MKAFFFCFASLCVAQVALAQSVPVPKVGGSCPTGTYSSQGSCVPNGNTQVFITDGGCPQGWVRSGNGRYCVK